MELYHCTKNRLQTHPRTQHLGTSSQSIKKLYYASWWPSWPFLIHKLPNTVADTLLAFLCTSDPLWVKDANTCRIDTLLPTATVKDHHHWRQSWMHCSTNCKVCNFVAFVGFSNLHSQPDTNDEKDKLELESTMSYLTDKLQVSIENAELFVALELLQAPAVGVITRRGYVDGWKVTG